MYARGCATIQSCNFLLYFVKSCLSQMDTQVVLEEPTMPEVLNGAAVARLLGPFDSIPECTPIEQMRYFL
jgi:hypothetical protein